MENLKEILENVLSEMQYHPVIYGNNKFWEDVDKEILREIKNGNCF